jgi:hypothetical protein
MDLLYSLGGGIRVEWALLSVCVRCFAFIPLSYHCCHTVLLNRREIMPLSY